MENKGNKLKLINLKKKKKQKKIEWRICINRNIFKYTQ